MPDIRWCRHGVHGGLKSAVGISTREKAYKSYGYVDLRSIFRRWHAGSGPGPVSGIYLLYTCHISYAWTRDSKPVFFYCCLRFDHPALCWNNDISADRVPWWNGNNPLHLFYVREEGVEILFCVYVKKKSVMTRPGDVIAGGSGGMGPCPPPQHQPPGIIDIYLIYTWFISVWNTYAQYILDIYQIYTFLKWYMSGICL